MKYKQVKVPEFAVTCSHCGAKYRTTDWDLAYRCKECGEETDVWFPREYGE